MKSRAWSALLFVTAATCVIPSLASAADLKKGDKLQTLVNLHPDMQRHVLYTLNYQLPGLIPACSEVIIGKVGGKKLSFTWQGQEFELGYEGFTKGAGVSFQQAAQKFFGPACDKAKMQSLGKKDQEGIRAGHAEPGMTRDGVLFAMGPPPVHANPDPKSPTWTYWRNRYVRMTVDFDASGKVSAVK